MDTQKYVTIGSDGVAEYEEKKSIFIGHAFHVKSEEEATEKIKYIRNKYNDARHNVHAFLIGNGSIARSTDDGEPSGSAGIPVLEVIRKNGITDTCVIVTRYFGGILLGAGGLVRAYSAAAKSAIEAAGIVTYESHTVLRLICSYSDYQRMLPELSRVNAIIDSTDYSDNVIICFAVKDELVNPLQDRIKEMSGGRISPEITGKRFDCQ